MQLKRIQLQGAHFDGLIVNAWIGHFCLDNLAMMSLRLVGLLCLWRILWFLSYPNWKRIKDTRASAVHPFNPFKLSLCSDQSDDEDGKKVEEGHHLRIQSNHSTVSIAQLLSSRIR